MLEHLKLLKELSSFLPLDRGTRILEIGQGELSTLFNQEIDESNVVINLIPLTVEEIGKEEYISDIFSTIIEISKSNQYYDAIVIPDFFNFLSKKKAFELLNLLLKITKESVFILINEFQSKEPLFIPDFKNYDISYYSLDGFCHSLIKIFRKDTLSEIKLYPKVGNYSELPLTIMYVMPHRNLTGGLKMLYEQMKSLQKKGHKIKVIIKGDYPKVVPEWVEGFIPDEEIIIPLYDKYTNYLNDIDIVFAGFYNQISELENNKVPVLYWEQGHEYLYGDFKDKGMEKVIRKSLQNGFKHDIYLATDSSYVHDIVKARFNKDSYILPIFIDTDFYYPIESKLESDPLTILLVGNPALTFKGFQKPFGY